MCFAGQVELTTEEIITLTCGIMFFVSFFIAMTVEIKARHTIYRLFLKFLSHNTEWQIEPYQRVKDFELTGTAPSNYVWRRGKKKIWVVQFTAGTSWLHGRTGRSYWFLESMWMEVEDWTVQKKVWKGLVGVIIWCVRETVSIKWDWCDSHIQAKHCRLYIYIFLFFFTNGQKICIHWTLLFGCVMGGCRQSDSGWLNSLGKLEYKVQWSFVSPDVESA